MENTIYEIINGRKVYSFVRSTKNDHTILLTYRDYEESDYTLNRYDVTNKTDAIKEMTRDINEFLKEEKVKSTIRSIVEKELKKGMTDTFKNNRTNTYKINLMDIVKAERMNEMKKITWDELTNAMIEFNKEHDITSKGTKSDTRLNGVVVFTENSFDKFYTVEERSYKFDNHNKAFIPSSLSNSVFANCLDGKDTNVRIDMYISGDWDKWDIEYCYLSE